MLFICTVLIVIAVVSEVIHVKRERKKAEEKWLHDTLKPGAGLFNG